MAGAIALQEKAEQAHPANESHQDKWMKAVQFLGPRWVALVTSEFKAAPVTNFVPETPPMAHKVSSIIRKRAQS